MDPQFAPDYSAALNHAAYYRLQDAGCLQIAGQDRVAFLQRQTTNDLNRLSAGHSILTVLVSPTARILDVLRLLQDDISISILTLPGRAGDTFNYLKNRIFFMDKVELSNLSTEYAQLNLLGPQSADLLHRFGLGNIPDKDEVNSVEIAGCSINIIGLGSPDSLGYRLLIPIDGCPAVEAALADSGAARLTNESYQVLRVEAGLPAAGFELVADYTPLETGLKSAISDSKGCYTGQEIIARQLTYDKVTRSLVGLRLESAAQPGESVWFDGKPVGKLTSYALSPRFGPIALGVIKRPHNQPGSTLLLGASPEDTPKSGSALVSALPF